MIDVYSEFSKILEQELNGKDTKECLEILNSYLDTIYQVRNNYISSHYMEYISELRENIKVFFKNLNNLSVKYKGQLKRNLGNDKFDYVVFRCVPQNLRIRNRFIIPLVAKIYFFMDCESVDRSFAKVLGDILSSNSSVNDFENLLDDDMSRVEYFSRNLIKFVRLVNAKNKVFNVENFMLDLILWGNSNKSVQLEWANDFYSTFEMND